MKKDLIATPLLPFTDDEDTALSDKLNAMDPIALGNYIDSARLALANTALDPSWRPRVEIGLRHAEAALLNRPPVVEPAVAEVAAAAPAPKSKAKKAEA